MSESNALSDDMARALPDALISPPLALGKAAAPGRSVRPIPLGVMASGSGSNFEAVLEAIASGRLTADVRVLIYNNPQAKAAERAQRHGVKAVLLNHREFESREALDAAVAQTLQEHGVEWVVMAGWMRIVTQTLLDAFPGRMINIHPSLLPSFKGIRAIEQALASGVTITGCTVHIVTLEMDSGPILMQAAVPILPGDNADSLHRRIQVQEHRILPEAIARAAAQPSSNSAWDA